MEPLNDDELRKVLSQWRTPPAPARLNSRIRIQARPVGWRWLLRGTIQVPVPIGVLLLVAVIALSALAVRPTPSGVPGAAEGLSNFQLVQDLNPRIVRISNEHQ